MTADPAALAMLSKAIPQLSQVPQCALPAFGAIAAAGCGPQLDCICGNDNFFVTLQGVTLQGTCTPAEAQESLDSIRRICIEAVPWLSDNRAPEVVAVTTVLTVLATIAVILRCVARRMSRMKFGPDDWLIFLALLFAYGLAIVQYLGVHYGFGKHILLLDLHQVIAFTKLFFAVTVIFPVSCAAAKLSVLYFYQRIFPSRGFRIISIIIGVVVIIWFIAFIFLSFFTCIPLEYTWDKSIPGGHCISSNRIAYYGTSPGDIATNLAILILPIPYLWKLQMKTIKKIAVVCIFILGGFATVGSIVRVPLLTELKLTDASYTVVNSGIWVAVELNIGILSVSLPILRPLFTKHFPSAFRSRFSRSHTSRYGTGSRRLPDLEKNKGSVGSSENTSNGIYSGAPKGHKTWYSNVVTSMGSKDEDASEGSREEMVPMGKINVRREVDWQENERDRLDTTTTPGHALSTEHSTTV